MDTSIWMIILSSVTIGIIAFCTAMLFGKITFFLTVNVGFAIQLILFIINLRSLEFFRFTNSGNELFDFFLTMLLAVLVYFGFPILILFISFKFTKMIAPNSDVTKKIIGWYRWL